jgi:hypothetical protein
MGNDVTLEFVHKILLEDTPEYQQIKKIAERDLGQELIDSIHKFLEEKHQEKPPEELKKVIFEDASKVHDRDINNIVDAFIRIRTDTLDEIEKKSIDDILILFNQWVTLGKKHPDLEIPAEVFALPPTPTTEEQISLEEQLHVLQESLPMGELYQSETLIPTEMQLYSDERQQIYESMGPASKFTTHHDEKSHNPFYQSKAEYKIH